MIAMASSYIQFGGLVICIVRVRVKYRTNSMDLSDSVSKDSVCLLRVVGGQSSKKKKTFGTLMLLWTYC